MRLLPGAVGNEASTRQESFTVEAKLRKLGWCGLDLRFEWIAGLSALHAASRVSWNRGARSFDVGQPRRNPPLAEAARIGKTLRNRPDLLEGAALGEEDKEILAAIKKMGSG